jgi:hypothetical protein
MALIKHFRAKDSSRESIHNETSASYSIFERRGTRVLQIDTYGHGTTKVSQTIQLSQEGASELYAILKKTFNFE